MVSLIYLLLAFITLYTAGCYYNFNVALFDTFRGQLFFLFIVEVILYLVMLILAFLFKRHTTFVLVPQKPWVQKGKKLSCSLIVHNSLFLPSRYLAKIRICSKREKDKETIQIRGVAPQHDMSRISFSVSSVSCGFMEMNVKRFLVQDAFRLFRMRKKEKWSGTGKIAVIPGEKILKVEPGSNLGCQNVGNEDNPFPAAGTEVSEIYQFREYAPGDSMKNIYWNLSARNDDFWIKEYSRAKGQQAAVFLDLLERETMTAERLDAFYEIVSALVLGLLGSYGGVIVSWFDAEQKSMITKSVSCAEDRIDMFIALYHAKFTSAEKVDENSYYTEIEKMIGSEVLRIDLSLALYYGKHLAKRFTEQAYETEISDFKVVMP